MAKSICAPMDEGVDVESTLIGIAYWQVQFRYTMEMGIECIPCVWFFFFFFVIGV